VFGTDESLTEQQGGSRHEWQKWLTGVRGWTWQRLRGYPSLRERRASLTAQLKEYSLQPVGPAVTR
jgi:hypothetical protein